MDLKVNGVNGRYSIMAEECVGSDYITVRVTPYAYVGIKNDKDGFRQYDIVAKNGAKIMTINNDRERYVESKDMLMMKDYFVVTYHQRMTTAEMINQVAYDYTGKEIELTEEQCKSNRQYFSHEPVRTATPQICQLEEDDVMEG